MRVMLAALLLSSCGDETVTAHSEEDLFALQAINDQPFDASATLNISEPGRISGQAPCNSYFAAQTAPYPWFDLGPIASTKRACAELKDESLYLETLARMTIVEVSGPVLILTNDMGEKMVFQAP